MQSKHLKIKDKELFELIKKEENRQKYTLSLIPSENCVSEAVKEAVGSCLMQKYSEGNIGRRYYEGNEIIDEIEQLTKDRARKLFDIPLDWDVNVQALSGSNANLAIYLALLKPGDKILSLYLPDGGHLSHGWSYDSEKKEDPNSEVHLAGNRKVTISSKMFNIVQYKTDIRTHLLNYSKIKEIAEKYRPNLIITGGTAYSRDIDYAKIKEIASSVGAYYLADIAHEAGLVAAGVLNSPIGVADVVSMTTHKTLRSARGAIILANKEIIEKVNKAVLPGLQGGPFNNNIAGICVGLGEALKPAFKKYALNIIENAKLLSYELSKYGFKMVTGGTDKHLLLINLTNKGISGKYASRALSIAGIITNMNTMPGEKGSPMNPSAIRMGTPLITSRGMGKKEIIKIAGLIDAVINEACQHTDLEFEKFQEVLGKSKIIKGIRKEVKKLCIEFPLQK